MKTKPHAMRFFEPDNGGNPTGGGSPDAPPDAPPSLLGGTSDPAPPPAGGSEPAWINPDGTFSEKWTDKLPDDIKASPTLSKYKTVADLAKALHNANALIGKKTLVPTDKSTPEEIAAYRQAIGIPDDVSKYDIKPAEMPEGLGWNEENAKRFAELGFKNNIPPAAMQAIVAEYGSMRLAEMEAIATEVDQRREAGKAELQREWGNDFQKNIGLAQQAAKLAGADAESFGFGDPNVVKAFVKLVGMLSDDKLISAGGGNQLKGGAAQADDIQTNPDNPLHKKYREGDPQTVALVRELRQRG